MFDDTKTDEVETVVDDPKEDSDGSETPKEDEGETA